MTRAKSIWASSDGSLKTYKEPIPFFLGVYSATVGITFPTGQQEKLGLGVVWYGNLIEEIIDSLTKRVRTPDMPLNTPHLTHSS